MVEEVGESSIAPCPKRSLFSKPTCTQPVEHDEAISFFSRAKELYPIVLKENDRERQKKAARFERKRSSSSVAREGLDHQEGKKRCISSYSEDDSEHSSSTSPKEDLQDGASRSHRESTRSTPGSRKSRSSSTRHKSQGSPTPRSQLCDTVFQSDKLKSLRNRKQTKDDISLSDSEDGAPPARKAATETIGLEDDNFNPSAKAVTQLIDDDDDLQMSEEEFPELVQKAREREKQKALERPNSGARTTHQGSESKGESTPEHDGSSLSQSKFTSTPELDPIIEIFISSYIQETKPLKVRRKLSQDLKSVRLSWCDRQMFDGQPMGEGVRASIFLTWRGMRLFDFSTCKSMGLKVGPNGKFRSDGEGFDEDGRVHMEAWTEGLFAVHRKRVAADQRYFSQDQGHSDPEDDPEPKLRKETVLRIKLIMTAKDLGTFKLAVKPTTLVEKMITTFRQAKRVTVDKEIVLYFDGDKLDPASTIQDTDLEEMDNVEVKIK